MIRPVLVVTVACTVLAGVRPASAQSPPTQLDRVKQKLDTILHRLDQLEPGQAGAPSPPPSAPAPAAAPAATPALLSTPETLAGGAGAIIDAAPATPVAAHEIPADSMGGFIYTGGPLQLADLADHGVRYAGLVGVEWQGWMHAKEAGRYELDVDGSTVSPNNYTGSTCVFAGWLEDRAIGVQEATHDPPSRQRLDRSYCFGPPPPVSGRSPLADITAFCLLSLRQSSGADLVLPL